MTPAARPFPVVFVSHGSPMVAIEHDSYTEAIAARIPALGNPAAVVVVSAHWETSGAIRVTTADRPTTLHDFGGFPAELYGIEYPAPGSPALGATVLSLLTGSGLAAVADPARGLDHGAWVPLRLAFPDATIPVVAVSLPRPRTPALVASIGRALAPLRDENVLLLGSGGLVHNLGRVRFDSKDAAVEPWAREFDLWMRERLEEFDQKALFNWFVRAPHAALAHPTTEHLDPLFFALGARRETDRVVDLFEGFQYGTLSMRSLALGG